jgi:hypothetical protein
MQLTSEPGLRQTAGAGTPSFQSFICHKSGAPAPARNQSPGHPPRQRLKAGDGNRTHTTSLEGWSSTIELRPQEISCVTPWWLGRNLDSLPRPPVRNLLSTLSPSEGVGFPTLRTRLGRANPFQHAAIHPTISCTRRCIHPPDESPSPNRSP